MIGVSRAWALGSNGWAHVSLRMLAFLALLFAFGQSAWAKEFHFDPASCKHDTGHMYVALGRTVFVTPTPKQANSIVDPNPGLPHPKPPDPTEPAGCFGNPLQSGSFGLFWSATLTGAAPGNTTLGAPDYLAIFNLNRRNRLSSQAGEWGMQRVNLRIAEDECSGSTVQEDLPNGLVACRIRPTDPKVPQADWRASYIAKKDVYTTPLGKPFVVICGPGLFSGPIGHCDVAYELNSDIGVTYNFAPYHAANPITFDKIIAFDKSLRAAIEAAVVKDYPWPK